MPDLSVIFKEVNAVLKLNTKMLIAEPSGHVSDHNFKPTLDIALKTGFKLIDQPKVNGSKTAVLEKILNA